MSLKWVILERRALTPPLRKRHRKKGEKTNTFRPRYENDKHGERKILKRAGDGEGEEVKKKC